MRGTIKVFSSEVARVRNREVALLFNAVVEKVMTKNGDTDCASIMRYFLAVNLFRRSFPLAFAGPGFQTTGTIVDSGGEQNG